MYCDRPHHVALKTRMWSTDDWAPGNDETPLEIFELDIDGNHRLPRGICIFIFLSAYSLLQFNQLTCNCKQVNKYFLFSFRGWISKWLSTLKPLGHLNTNIMAIHEFDSKHWVYCHFYLIFIWLGNFQIHVTIFLILGC